MTFSTSLIVLLSQRTPRSVKSFLSRAAQNYFSGASRSVLGPALLLTFCFCRSLLWKDRLGPSGTSKALGKGHSSYLRAEAPSAWESLGAPSQIPNPSKDCPTWNVLVHSLLDKFCPVLSPPLCSGHSCGLPSHPSKPRATFAMNSSDSDPLLLRAPWAPAW